MAGRKIRDEHEARRCLTAAAASRLPRADWARANAIDGRSLNAWRLNLKRVAAEPESRPLRLVELVPSVAPGTAASRYRIECGVFVVEVDDHFDDEVLGRVLVAVARC